MSHDTNPASQGIRAFIAYILPLDTAALLHKKVKRLQGWDESPVRWTPPQNFHLTLRFLGDSSAEQLEKIKEGLRHELEGFHSFISMSGGVQYFPSDNHPRIMTLTLHSGRRMNDLNRVCERVSCQAGYTPEQRLFRPHVTLARSLSRPLSILPWQIPGYRFNVAELALVQSELRPDGARYRIMETFPLR
ncbi:RNA 2',3'-cyclic phosphodiesterase [Sansalvadorimonas sp. 2012CJ34-2]|uniref:RNA 2',3'-cyclic phosphodiesterase n=1 Tax=Parendozoicomonas callyspongiae TaxID=2942213 RepID=A0ABT0PF86_9GAMM|nr:RNA 2',3'-cyclic phosphodiesterase [Sansalvadorimonas sp. 2012CJ34-2]MCL6269437.1 RNA 2',3'-cyclic phosphodiesterase [Sansalvadorimonas sp. 2012CJ34-2]